MMLLSYTCFCVSAGSFNPGFLSETSEAVAVRNWYNLRIIGNAGLLLANSLFTDLQSYTLHVCNYPYVTAWGT